jgi:hypothetical protein
MPEHLVDHEIGAEAFPLELTRGMSGFDGDFEKRHREVDSGKLMVDSLKQGNEEMEEADEDEI